MLIIYQIKISCLIRLLQIKNPRLCKQQQNQLINPIHHTFIKRMIIYSTNHAINSKMLIQNSSKIYFYQYYLVNQLQQMNLNKKQQHIRFSQNAVTNIARQFSDLLNRSNSELPKPKQPTLKPIKLAEYIQQKSESRKRYNFMGFTPQVIAQEQYNKKTRKKKNELCQIIEQAIKFLKQIKITIMHKSDLKMLELAQPKIRQLYESIGKSNLRELTQSMNNESNSKSNQNLSNLNSIIHNKKNSFQSIKLTNHSYIDQPNNNPTIQNQKLSNSSTLQQIHCSKNQSTAVGGIDFFKLLTNKQVTNHNPSQISCKVNEKTNSWQNSVGKIQQEQKVGNLNMKKHK